MSAEKAIVKKFLDSQETGVLAVVDENNKPHAATINYVTDDDLNLYFITKTATKKFTSLSQNPHVAMTVTDMDSKKTVQIEGQAHEAKDIDQQSEIMKKLASPHKDSSGVWVPPIAEIEAGSFVVLKLTPSSTRYADFGSDPSNVIEL